MKSKNRIFESGGVITEADGAKCTLRLRLPAGITTAGALRSLCDITEQFGLSDIHLTTRQTVEIPHIAPVRSGAGGDVDNLVSLRTGKPAGHN